MKFCPRPYQTMIRDHILDVPRCAIWAGMGMGKTTSTLDAIDTLALIDDAPVLVLAPLRVARSTWPQEAAKWDHLKAMNITPIVGSESERHRAIKLDAQIHTMNYENLEWLVSYWGNRWPYRTVIADESTKLKGFRLRQGGKRAQALARVSHTKIKRFVQLTGTPSPNGLSDLWGQAWYLDAGQRLGRTFTSFQERWFRTAPNGFGLVALPHAQIEIQHKLRDLCLTVDAKDWFDLREPIVNNIFVDLPTLFENKLFQIGVHRIARRNNADGFAVLDHGDVTESVFLHQQQGVTIGFVGRQRLGVGRHDLRQRRRLGIQPLGNDTKHHIALGKNTHQFSGFEHQNGTSVFTRHQPGGVTDCCLWWCGKKFLTVHQVFDRLLKHSCLLRPMLSGLSPISLTQVNKQAQNNPIDPQIGAAA